MPIERINNDRFATVARVEKVIDSIDLSTFPLPLVLHVNNCGCPSQGHLMVTMTAKDREFGHKRDLTATRDVAEITKYGTATTAEILNNIRLFVHDIVVHELYECFKVDGERVFDPHNELKRPAECNI